MSPESGDVAASYKPRRALSGRRYPTRYPGRLPSSWRIAARPSRLRSLTTETVDCSIRPKQEPESCAVGGALDISNSDMSAVSARHGHPDGRVSTSFPLADRKYHPGPVPNQRRRRQLSAILGARARRTPHDKSARVSTESALVGLESTSQGPPGSHPCRRAPMSLHKALHASGCGRIVLNSADAPHTPTTHRPVTGRLTS